ACTLRLSTPSNLASALQGMKLSPILHISLIIGFANSVVLKQPVVRRLKSSSSIRIFEQERRAMPTCSQSKACRRCRENQHVSDIAPHRLINFFDSFYLGNISFGTPEQTMSVSLDTGSAHVWVISANCLSRACNGYPESRHTKVKFDKYVSSTYIDSYDPPLDLSYYEGSAKVVYGADVLNIAGLRIERQDFGTAIQISEEFGLQPIDGILGLAWPELIKESYAPPMQNLMPILDEPVFTVFLTRHKKQQTGSEGRRHYLWLSG
ncbi:hypothetical protein PFISCL1PPCAC_22809, partial [Pristionchus fissidentatus]